MRRDVIGSGRPASTCRGISRRDLLSGAGALAWSWAGAPKSEAATDTPALAVTIDDFELRDTPGLGGAARHQAILDALDRYKIKACGFPAGKYIDNREGADHLRVWAGRGHLLGNHSYTHPYFSGSNPPALAPELQQAESLLTPYPTFRKLFRFPYLAEGKMRESRDRMRDILRQTGYRNGYVTIDTSDWYIAARLVARLQADPAADLAPYRKYYLDHLWNRAEYYDGLAKRVLGRSITHTILLHHNLAGGLFLADALAMFGARGWRLADAADAFAQPLFASQPDIVPAGQSLIWALAKEQGGFEAKLRYPGEDDSYEKPGMDALGL
jgi:peptidoglycan/xylan/chitin deacetylase (PgdA/CDA1 family)